MNAAQFTRLVPDCREVKPDQFAGPCPACGGSPRSRRFRFRDGDDGVLIFCFSCGDSDAILRALNLRWSDLSHNATARRDPYAVRRRQAQAIVRSWRSSELTSICERLRHLDNLQFQAGLLLKRDPDNETAWLVLPFVYAERPALERDFERLTLSDEARHIEVFMERKDAA